MAFSPTFEKISCKIKCTTVSQFITLSNNNEVHIHPPLHVEHRHRVFQIRGAGVFLLSVGSVQSLQLLECIGSEINSLAYIGEVRSSIPELNINILISQPWLSSFFAMNGARLVTSSSRCYWCDSRNLPFFFFFKFR